jgi:cell division protein FtsN
MKAQRGGTLTGLIIGLLVGLAVALGVAMYVTKAPIPLMDRGVQRKPDQDAQEKERNKDWNPNAGLGNKSVPSPSSSAEPEATAPTQAPATPVATDTKPSSKPAAGKPADPLGDLMQSRAKETPAADKATPTDPAADPFVYYVQAGAYRNADEAEGQRAKLAMLGFDAKVTEREQAGKPVFRVRVGPFGKKVEADIMQERLKGQNVDTALVRVQR